MVICCLLHIFKFCFCFFFKYCLFVCFFLLLIFFGWGVGGYFLANFAMIEWGDVSSVLLKMYQQLQLTFTLFLNHRIMKVNVYGFLCFIFRGFFFKCCL